MTDAYQSVAEAGFDDPKWDDFLSQIEWGHHEQTTCWARVKQHQGWEPIRVKTLRRDELVAGAQILCKRLPWGGLVGYASCGPCYAESDSQILDCLMRAINRTASDRNIQYLVMTPYREDDLLPTIMEKHGYAPTEERLPPTATTRATLIIDLSKDAETLLMEMRAETRRQIKLASQRGFVFREGTREDLRTLFKLMSTTAERRGENPVPGSVTVFEHIWDCFQPRDYVRLFSIERKGEPVSAQMVFAFGNDFRLWKFGWTGEYAKEHPNQLCHWEMIKWAKNHGFRYYDIVQVDPIITDRISSGLPMTEEIKSRKLFGPTFFKTNFGGKVVKFSGPWFRFSKPLMRFCYHSFGPALLGTPWAKKFISHMCQ